MSGPQAERQVLPSSSSVNLTRNRMRNMNPTKLTFGGNLQLLHAIGPVGGKNYSHCEYKSTLRVYGTDERGIEYERKEPSPRSVLCDDTALVRTDVHA